MTSPMNDILYPSKMDTSISYYEDLSRVSNSSLGYFIQSVFYFKQKMLGLGKDIVGKFLQKGQMIHKYILEYPIFWNEYEIQTFTKPSSANQLKFAETYAKQIRKLKDPTGAKRTKALCDSYADSYVTKGKSEASILEEAVDLYDKLEDYINSIYKESTKIGISFIDNVLLKTIAKNIQDHPFAHELIYPVSDSVFSELHINWIHTKTGLACKSLIDRLIIDNEKKLIRLVDLKTTATITEFKTSMGNYGYYRQLAFYKMAIEWYFENVLELDFSEYTFEAYIVAISTNATTENEVRVFRIYDYQLNPNSKLIDALMEELKWHFDNDKFEHSKECYETGLDKLDSKWEVQTYLE